jgi:hypothetical protein
MLCYECYINGDRLYQAGGATKLLGAHVMWLDHPAHGITFGVSGLNHDEGSVHWESRKLKVGDEVIIKIVESERTDPPKPLKTENRPSEVESARSEHRRLKAKIAELEAQWGEELATDMADA